MISGICRTVAAAAAICCLAPVAEAGADLDGIRADGIAEHKLVLSGIDLSHATAQPVPTITLPALGGAGALKLAQATPRKGPDVSDTGNPAVAPLKWVGLVIYQVDQTHVDLCTGQFIAPRIVLTAGHCVKNEGVNTWKDVNNMSFILQFQNGGGSHVYKAVCAATLNAYSYPANYAQLPQPQQDAAMANAGQADYAMILVDADSVTGVMRTQADWKGKWLGATRVGYPAQILGGEVIQEGHGIVFFADAIPIFTNNGNTVSYPNLVTHWQNNLNLTQGTSGGAWVASASSDEAPANNVAISVTSFNNTAFPGAIFGPYFTGDGFNNLLKYTQAGCKS